jgi:hypothetical protein
MVRRLGLYCARALAAEVELKNKTKNSLDFREQKKMRTKEFNCCCSSRQTACCQSVELIYNVSDVDENPFFLPLFLSIDLWQNDYRFARPLYIRWEFNLLFKVGRNQSGIFFR